MGTGPVPSLAIAPSDLAPLALTMGDPAGIGLEITLIAWLRRTEHKLKPFVLFGDAEAVAQRARQIGIDVPVRTIGRIAETTSVFDQALPVIAVPLATPAVAGRPESANARAVIASIEQATAATARRSASALVTNPIAKNVLYGAGFRHPGHTEFLAALATRHNPGHTYTPVMMLSSAELRVVPLTVHVPVAVVPGLITQTLIIDTVRITHESLLRDFAVTQPRIAITGLNPHAGEAGSIGHEDETVILPAIELLKGQGFTVSGPHPADTLFHAAARQGYDAVIAMYHDQALIPIKTLAFDRGINVTLGLPFVRTSPDHGTAFDIAGRGVARATSLIEAIKLAAELSHRRAAARPAE